MFIGTLIAAMSVLPATDKLGPYLGYAYQPSGVGVSRLATMPDYPVGRVDDVRRPGFNGRLWLGETFIGGVQGPYPLAWGSPGPTAYGASDRDFSEVHARVGHQVVTISPWISISTEGLKNLEAARNEWLKREGYVGGVRTFVNDLYVFAEPTLAQREPRATIQLPIDMPSFRSRQQVMKFQPGDRVSLPPTASGAMVARVAKLVDADRGSRLASR